MEELEKYLQELVNEEIIHPDVRDEILYLAKPKTKKMSKCNCDKPTLQPQTKQCGKCKLDIDFQRVFKRKRMLLLNQNKDK